MFRTMDTVAASFVFPYKLVYFLFLKESGIVRFCVGFRVICMLRHWRLGLIYSSCQVEWSNGGGWNLHTISLWLQTYRPSPPIPPFNDMILVKFKGCKFGTDWRKSFPWYGDHWKYTIYQKISQKNSVDEP